MINLKWEIKKGDLVKISSDDKPSAYSYGVVVSKAPFTDQLSLFPAVMVFSFVDGCEHQYYPYNLEIVSAVI